MARVLAIKWCELLSAIGHRHCTVTGCECECHTTYNSSNYEKNRLSSVKRIG